MEVHLENDLVEAYWWPLANLGIRTCVRFSTTSFTYVSSVDDTVHRIHWKEAIRTVSGRVPRRRIAVNLGF